MQHLEIKFVPGKQGPFYAEGTQQLKVEKCVVIEQGTEANLPFVDFVMKGEHGEQYLMVLTGRMVLSLAAALRGVNMRNHGVAEP